MAAIAVDTRLGKTLRFYNTTIGKKVIMAATEAAMFGYLIAHLLGNLQVFVGRAQMNHYAVVLHSMPAVLWAARIVLLVCLALHITATVQLAALKNSARPVGYKKKSAVGSSYASRTMYWSG